MMKLVLLVVCCWLGTVACLNNAAVRDQFTSFIATYGKQYSTIDEYYHRLSIFTENVALIEKLNGNNDGATYAVNQFADLSRAEFKSQKLSSLLVSTDPMESYPHYVPNNFVMTAPIPDSYDWRNNGAVTPVKDQASCGSCWAFSAIANMEGQHFLAGNPLIDLSEEQVVECDTHDCGCLGGWPWFAYEYLIEHGAQQETSYPYCVPPLGDCYVCQVDKNKTFCGPGPNYCNTTCNYNAQNVAARISNWTRASTNETEIAAFLVAKGPLSVLMDATWLQFYHSGVSDPWFCSDTALDHAVTMVGYGTEGHTDYWIVKNSWGEKWGECGYFRIIRGKGKCVRGGASRSLRLATLFAAHNASTNTYMLLNSM